MNRACRQRPPAAAGPQILLELFLVLRDRGVGEREDLRRRAVVQRQAEDLRVRISLRKPQDVRERSAAERVDRLRVVADDSDVPADLPHAVHDVALQLVGVLVLVDENVIVGRGELRGDFGSLREQASPGE